jgi:hypothetical protein
MADAGTGVLRRSYRGCGRSKGKVVIGALVELIQWHQAPLLSLGTQMTLHEHVQKHWKIAAVLIVAAILAYSVSYFW